MLSNFGLLLVIQFSLSLFALEKDTLDIWVNGQKKETIHEFADEGTEIIFELDIALGGCIKTMSSGNKKQGMIYVLTVNNNIIEESST